MPGIICFSNSIRGHNACLVFQGVMPPVEQSLNNFQFPSIFNIYNIAKLK